MVTGIEHESTDRPLAIDLFCGLGGWTEGLMDEGYRVVGFDNQQHVYGEARYPAQLVVQDVLTIHGRQFKNAALIVGSSPCQEFSYRAMPWKRAKALPPPYLGMKLFEAQFRIQREACEAAGRFIPLVVENVRGAQKFVGRARWHYGSFYLWGDVPALMPIARRAQKFSPDGTSHGVGSWFAIADSKNRGASGTKNDGGSWFAVAHNTTSGHNPDGRPNNARDRAVEDGRKQPGISGTRRNGKGDGWFQDGAASHGSKSSARKAASAHIAKIPYALARHIARAWWPVNVCEGVL